MHWPRLAYRWLIWLFILGLGVQFFLAGLGVLGGESIDPHRGLGSLLQLVSILLLLLAAFGRMGRQMLGMSVALVALMVLQSLWASEDLGPVWLRSFHILGAFMIGGLTQQIVRQAGWPLASESRGFTN